MKKLCFCVLASVVFMTFNSCSSSSAECGQTLEPSANEFTYKCDRYTTEVGQFSIRSPRNGVSACHVQMVNNTYGDFIFNEGDNHLNIATITIVVPQESYVSREIPVGVYHLRHIGPNEQFASFDIESSQVAYNSSVELTQTGAAIFMRTEEGDDFDDAVLTISKSGSIYTIEYLLSTIRDTEIKGKFVGEMEVVNNPN